MINSTHKECPLLSTLNIIFMRSQMHTLHAVLLFQACLPEPGGRWLKLNGKLNFVYNINLQLQVHNPYTGLNINMKILPIIPKIFPVKHGVLGVDVFSIS